MQKLFLIVALLFVIVPLTLVKAAKTRCTAERLRATYQQNIQRGAEVTHLQRKTWWRNCPLSIRKSVYAGLFAPAQISSSSVSVSSSRHTLSVQSDLPILGKAPELQGLGQWFNSDPLTIASLRGKVVLVHFWTFECINCIHTLPAIQGYWDKYREKPFVVLGVHTPEFTFEKSADHLRDAIKKDGLTYPVVQDNDFATWNAFGNQYWPAAYIIDTQGTIRYEHFGEGEYETMDKAIHDLLGEAGA
ncbi:redoxin domain-containing protein [Candidatus Peregrinibacteria bacterium]|nr:redoxin domain-containing protein [Candidatus Peregrinibacteria bacterium]